MWANLNAVLNKSLTSVCVCIPLIAARQRLGKNVTVATNTHATIKIIPGRIVFYAIRFVSRKSGD
jgi:hypothetical protein